ncbi:unnamed protein product, partial [Arabidopsis halleri]
FQHILLLFFLFSSHILNSQFFFPLLHYDLRESLCFSFSLHWSYQLVEEDSMDDFIRDRFRLITHGHLYRHLLDNNLGFSKKETI